jgi:hypothetical protein
MPDPVVITEESGAFRALKAERRIVKELEQKNRALREDLTARVERLEARGLAPFLEALAGMRRDMAAEQAKFHQEMRMELHDLAEQVDQLAAMVKAQP